MNDMEIINVALSICNSEFYRRHSKEIYSCSKISLKGVVEGYKGLLDTHEVLAMCQLHRIFNYGCSSFSYLRMHPSLVGCSRKDRESVNKQDVYENLLFSKLLKYSNLFDGPCVQITDSEDVHNSLLNAQRILHKQDSLSVVYSRMSGEADEFNPLGKVHPIRAMGRWCITCLPSSPIVVLTEISYLLEICRIWDYPLESLLSRIKLTLDKKLKDIKFKVAGDHSYSARHKNRLEFNRAWYIRELNNIYCPFPGVIVACTGFPIIRLEMIYQQLLPEPMFQWSAGQLSPYDTSEKIAKYRENSVKKVELEAL